MSIKNISSALALAGALVLIAGCGSSSSGSSGSSRSSGGALSASPSSTASPATEVELKKIVLREGDLPRTWKATPAGLDSGDNSGQAELMKCVGAKNTDEDQVATTDSDDFVLGDATISSSASSYKSAADLDSDRALLKSPKLTPCFNQVFKKQLMTGMPEDASIGAVSVRFTPGPGAGPANVAGSGAATVPVTANGQQAMVYINFVYLTGPLIEAEVDAENVGAPVPAAMLQTAVNAVAHRAAANG
jgi:hypothetical protein